MPKIISNICNTHRTQFAIRFLCSFERAQVISSTWKSLPQCMNLIMISIEAEYGYDEAEPEESAGGFVSGLSSTTDITNRMVTYNADMEIIVEDPETVLQAVIAMTQKRAAVVNSNLTKTTTDRGTLPRAT